MNHQKELYELALFAGIGGGILGSDLLGFRTVCGVEKEEYPQRVLMERQNDGTLPPFPIWDDVCTFDPGPWKGRVDLISGGFPCQDISIAGKGIGLSGERSGLWREMARIIDGIRPPFVFIENSPELAKKGLEYVLYDLARMGYDAAWNIYSAADVGAPHLRRRLWILAVLNTYCNGRQAMHLQLAQSGAPVRTAPSRELSGASSLSAPHARREGEQEGHGGTEGSTDRRAGSEGQGNPLADTMCDGQQAVLPLQTGGAGREAGQAPNSLTDEGTAVGLTGAPASLTWWSTEPGMGRVADGIPCRVDRIKALGNAQVPGVAAHAFRDLFKQLMHIDFSTWQNLR